MCQVEIPMNPLSVVLTYIVAIGDVRYRLKDWAFCYGHVYLLNFKRCLKKKEILMRCLRTYCPNV